MGNQDSVPAKNYVIKKKSLDGKTSEIYRSRPKNDNKSNNSKQNNKQNEIINQRKSKQPSMEKDYDEYNEYNNYNEDYEFTRPKSSTNEKNSNNSNNNNALMQRSLSDNFNQQQQQQQQQQYLSPYPKNSNNDLVNPKIKIDKLEFTPYNVSDEIGKFNSDIDNERIQFELEEKRKRELFEKKEREKREYLNNEINHFEEKYNPWEVLGLKQGDLLHENIKKAYKKMALKYHPDRAGEKYQEVFQVITQSYIYLLNKCEQFNEHDIKSSREVSHSIYEDNINEKVENIHISKDKFDLNQFNNIFEKYKLPDTFDEGYANLFKEDIDSSNKPNNLNEKNDDEIFGKKFNNDIFNTHFSKLKNKKHSSDLVEYQEPSAMESALNNNLQNLGLDKVTDFGAVNSNALSYTDYKRAHVDETLLIDASKVKYKTYNSIDQLESDRSNLSYTATPDEKKRYEYMERKKTEDDNYRTQQMRMKDDLVSNHYQKMNQRLIIHK
jgi:hypothetical protein